MLFFRKKISNIKFQELFIYCSLFACLYNSLNSKLFGLSVNPFFYISVLLGVIIFAIKIKRKEISLKSDYKLLIVYFLTILLMSFISSYTFDKQSIVILVVNMIMMIFLFSIDRDIDFKKYYLVILVFSFTICFLSFFFAILGFDFVYYGQKFTGLYSNPNLGSQVTLVTILILIYFLKKKYYNYNFLLLGLLIQVSFLFFNESRNVYLIFLILLAIYLIQIMSNRIRLCALVTIFLLIVIFVPNSNNMISDSLNIKEYTKTEQIINDISTERYAILKESTYIIKENFLFGCGVNTLQKAAKDEIGEVSRIVTRGITATHNVLFQTFIDGGIFAFLVFLIFLLILLKRIAFIIFVNKCSFFSDEGFMCIMILASLFFSFLDIGIVNYLILTSHVFWTHSSKILK